MTDWLTKWSKSGNWIQCTTCLEPALAGHRAFRSTSFHFSGLTVVWCKDCFWKCWDYKMPSLSRTCAPLSLLLSHTSPIVPYARGNDSLTRQHYKKNENKNKIKPDINQLANLKSSNNKLTATDTRLRWVSPEGTGTLVHVGFVCKYDTFFRYSPPPLPLQKMKRLILPPSLPSSISSPCHSSCHFLFIFFHSFPSHAHFLSIFHQL